MFLRQAAGAFLLLGVSVSSHPSSAQGVDFDRYRAHNEAIMGRINRAHALQREQQKEHHKVDKQYRGRWEQVLKKFRRAPEKRPQKRRRGDAPEAPAGASRTNDQGSEAAAEASRANDQGSSTP